MKLGILLEVGLSDNQLERIKMIEEVDISLAKLSLTGFSNQRLDEIERELKRFFALFVLDPETPHVITGAADQLWHEVIGDPASYKNFCQSSIGTFIRHNPVRPADKSLWNQFCQRTKSSYKRHFGPMTETFNEAMLCWGCGEDSRAIA